MGAKVGIKHPICGYYTQIIPIQWEGCSPKTPSEQSPIQNFLMCRRRRDSDHVPTLDCHHSKPPSRAQQQFQKHRAGSLNIGSLGQFDVGVNRDGRDQFNPQLAFKLPALAPGQNSIGTGGQYSIGADRLHAKCTCGSPNSLLLLATDNNELSIAGELLSQKQTNSQVRLTDAINPYHLGNFFIILAVSTLTLLR